MFFCVTETRSDEAVIPGARPGCVCCVRQQCSRPPWLRRPVYSGALIPGWSGLEQGQGRLQNTHINAHSFSHKASNYIFAVCEENSFSVLSLLETVGVDEVAVSGYIGGLLDVVYNYVQFSQLWFFTAFVNITFGTNS